MARPIMINTIQWPSREIARVFIHCSASDNQNHDNIQTIREWHLGRGWGDVGYHFFIDKTGNIYQGRPLELAPAAQRGHNEGSIAICLSGLRNFWDAQFNSLQQLCILLNSLYPNTWTEDYLTFHGHNEVSAKECPVFDYKKILALSPEGKLGMQMPDYSGSPSFQKTNVNAIDVGKIKTHLELAFALVQEWEKMLK